jgi:hypothetical protein
LGYFGRQRDRLKTLDEGSIPGPSNGLGHLALTKKDIATVVLAYAIS